MQEFPCLNNEYRMKNIEFRAAFIIRYSYALTFSIYLNTYYFLSPLILASRVLVDIPGTPDRKRNSPP